MGLSSNDGSVMVWANLSTEALTELIFAENCALNPHKHVEDVLHKVVVLFPHSIQDVCLMHENAKQTINGKSH